MPAWTPQPRVATQPRSGCHGFAMRCDAIHRRCALSARCPGPQSSIGVITTAQDIPRRWRLISPIRLTSWCGCSAALVRQPRRGPNISERSPRSRSSAHLRSTCRRLSVRRLLQFSVHFVNVEVNLEHAFCLREGSTLGSTLCAIALSFRDGRKAELTGPIRIAGNSYLGQACHDRCLACRT